jgi:hypothetical protein
MTPFTFLIAATAANLAVIWFTHPKGKRHVER